MTVNTEHLFEAWALAEQAAHRVIAPLETESDYEAALATLEEVWEAKAERPELGTLLGLLSERIAQYEAREYPMPEVSGARALAFLMRQHGLTQSALAQATGIDQTNLSRILSGERDFTTGQIRTLARHFGVSGAVFLG